MSPIDLAAQRGFRRQGRKFIRTLGQGAGEGVMDKQEGGVDVGLQGQGIALQRLGQPQKFQMTMREIGQAVSNS